MTMTITKTDMIGLARSAVEDAEILGDTLNLGYVPRQALDHYGLDNDAEIGDLLDSMALEVYGMARVQGQDPELQTITVVTGTGGPHTEFIVAHNDQVRGFAYWSSATAEQHAVVPGLWDYLEGIVAP